MNNLSMENIMSLYRAILGVERYESGSPKYLPEIMEQFPLVYIDFRGYGDVTIMGYECGKSDKSDFWETLSYSFVVGAPKEKDIEAAQRVMKNLNKYYLKALRLAGLTTNDDEEIEQETADLLGSLRTKYIDLIRQTADECINRFASVSDYIVGESTKCD